MKVVLFAATGRAGRTILNELVLRGHEVAAVARNPDALPAELAAVVTCVKDDFSQLETIADVIKGADALVSAFGPSSKDPRYLTDQAYTDQLVTVTERLIAAVQMLLAAGADTSKPRLLVVGGAGSLYFSPGVTVLDSGYWPPPYVPIAVSHTGAFAALRQSDINWTYFSPPMLIQPGERTGIFRLGEDDLVVDADGKSHISFEDYAVALVDELEQPAYEGKRFTVGY